MATLQTLLRLEVREYATPLVTALLESWENKEIKDDEIMEFWAYRHGYEYEHSRQNEISEYWIVSDWLADKLLDFNEFVVKDFYGLNIWGINNSRCLEYQASLQEIAKEYSSWI